MRSTASKDAQLRARLQEAVDKFANGSADAFGRIIGYTNGGYIREILGVKQKPVREKIIDRVHGASDELAGWFDEILGQPSTSGVAHSMSPDTSNLPPLIPWEDTMSDNDLPTVFRLAMPDGALASTPQGTVLFFSREEKPRPGWGVLFSDRHGCRHIRRYVEVRPGHWRAEATAPGFASFDSIADELTVLAAMTDKLADGSV